MDEQDSAFNWNEFGQRTWVVVVAGLVFAPLGIFLAWRKPDWTPKAKWIATGLMGLLFYGQFVNKTDALQSDARHYAELEGQFEAIAAKAESIQSMGDGRAAAAMMTKGKPIGLKAIEIRNKHKEKEAEFNAAVEKAKEQVAAKANSSASGLKSFTAVELLGIASNAARAKKELPSRFVVTGILQEVDQASSGIFGGKTYTAKLRGKINSRGLIGTWVECEMSNAEGLDRFGKGSYVEIEGEYESTLSEIVEMKKCSLNKAFHDE